MDHKFVVNSVIFCLLPDDLIPVHHVRDWVDFLTGFLVVHCILYCNLVAKLKTATRKKATAAGFEPARNKSKRFQVFRLNHSAKQPFVNISLHQSAVLPNFLLVANPKQKKATAAGFEPARNKSKRFLVFRLNHSAKQSSTWVMVELPAVVDPIFQSEGGVSK